MSKNNERDLWSIQGQWLFVAIGAFIAFFFGLTVNGLYELLREKTSALGIVIVFGSLGLFFLDFFFYFFENIRNFQENPDQSPRKIIGKYFRNRFKRPLFFLMIFLLLGCVVYWRVM